MLPSSESEQGTQQFERLQKVLARAGIGSRRVCEKLIVDQRVTVNGEIPELGEKVDPETSQIEVDGLKIGVRQDLVYYLVNKPTGVVCTNRDPGSRMRVIDLVPDGEQLFTVGRLDRSSEGLIIVTNDGDLSHRLAHPRFEVEKTYAVEVAGQLSQQELGRLRRGVHLAEAFTKATRITVKKILKHTTHLEIVLQEGRNREIRRMLARVGHKVMRLRRVRFGPLKLGNLPSGAVRVLSRQEVARLTQPKSGRAVKSRRKSQVRSQQSRNKTGTDRSGPRKSKKTSGPGRS